MVEVLRSLLTNQTEKPPQRNSSIHNYYSVENEIAFLKQNEEIPLEDRKYYVTENVFKFLGEFAGQVPYTSVRFQMKEGETHFPGIEGPVIDGYRKTAEMTQPNSREWAEYDGYSKIESAFGQGEATTAVWLSPPSPTENFGDYGFIFILEKEKNGDHEDVVQRIIRYTEKKGQLDETKRLFSRFTQGEDEKLGLQNEKDFLKNPIFYTTHNKREQSAIVQCAGLDEKSVDNSLKFEEMVRRDLSEWINQYAVSLTSLNDDISYSYDILTALYNRAQEISGEIRRGSYRQVQESYRVDRLAIEYYASKPTYFEDGGSCPVVSSQEIYNLLSNSGGKIGYHEASMIEPKRFPDYECPRCKTKHKGEIKGSDRNTWKKFCTCGFAFDAC